MRPIQAIETEYRGYRFRSRLEARWAVWLDAMGLRWRYEVEGFDVGGLFRYLPDFYLPDRDLYLEIKPDLPNDEWLEDQQCIWIIEAEPGGPRFTTMGKFLYAASQLQQVSGRTVHNRLMLVCGTPGLPRLRAGPTTWLLEDGAVWLALESIPEDQGPYLPMYAPAEINGKLDLARFYLAREPFVNERVYDCPMYPKGTTPVIYFGDGSRTYRSKRLRTAYRAARSARFERGERPAP
jgi:hypothetical protein